MPDRMPEWRRTTVSKYLAKHLRHAPEALGLTLQDGGWVLVDDLLAAAEAHGFPIDYDELVEVVETNDKARFAFDATGDRIRANQGHSVAVELHLEGAEPPPLLYHGTVARSLAAIRAEGLSRMDRHHVHLSADVATARRVGARRGRPVVLTIHAGRMHRDGHRFYRSTNGVWLTEAVPPAYLSEREAEGDRSG